MILLIMYSTQFAKVLTFFNSLAYDFVVTPLPSLSCAWISLKDQKLTTKTTLVQKFPNILVSMDNVLLNGLKKWYKMVWYDGDSFHRQHKTNSFVPCKSILVLINNEK